MSVSFYLMDGHNVSQGLFGMFLSNSYFANTGTILVNVRAGNEQYSRRGGWSYYKSEKRLQRFMLSKKVISFPTFVVNCLKRFVVEVCFTKRVRKFVYISFARNSK